MTFPKGFVWGTSTASYQIEGGAGEDGKQESVWDDACHWSNTVNHGHTGDTACDHYHRYREDVALMKAMGLKNYRFSVAWTRVLSYQSDYAGGAVKGAVNQNGLDFYNRLIDALLEAGITPWMTMYHWDMPMELERKGGWRNRDIMYWASDYAALLVKTFGDRVTHFFTINEMPCIAGGVSGREQLNVIHNLLLTHGRMAQTIRSMAKANTKIGFAHCGKAPYPLTDSDADIAACKKACTAYTDESGTLIGDCLTYWCDPIYFGHYPDGADKAFPCQMPVIKDGDMELISTPIDFHGQNIYYGPQIIAPLASSAADMARGFSIAPYAPGHPITEMRWPIVPRSMNYFVRNIYDRYKTPIVISENGMPGLDIVSPDGKCHDPLRIDFTRAYLKELGKAIQSGADVRGYFHWSLLDNFEWNSGYEPRFGLVHVDYSTQKRTPKDSSEWYKEVIATNGECL